jgi:hypothetical protein
VNLPLRSLGVIILKFAKVKNVCLENFDVEAIRLNFPRRFTYLFCKIQNKYREHATLRNNYPTVRLRLDFSTMLEMTMYPPTHPIMPRCGE